MTLTRFIQFGAGDYESPEVASLVDRWIEIHEELNSPP